MLLLCACSTETTETEAISNTEIESTQSLDSELNLTQTDSTFYEILDSFPKNWVQVEMKEGKTYFTKRCSTQNPGLVIAQDSASFILTTHYGNDFETWQLIHMTAEYDHVIGQEIQRGTMMVAKITYPDEAIYEVDYFWNKKSGFCTFGDFFAEGTRFANTEREEEFVIVTEPCD